MTHYSMVADLDRCIGCQTCVAACRHANATSPAVQWRKVLDFETGVYPAVSRTFVPVGCQHCDDPPCMHVCPTTATRKRPDGIVTVDYDSCIGCAYCDVACPYQARFKISEPDFAYGKDAMHNEALTVDLQRIGVSQKCTFCSDRIDGGRAKGLVPGRDPEATPVCVNACIADALTFGNVDDASSKVSQLLAKHAHFRMHEELQTAPNFYYLYDHHGVQANWEDAGGVSAGGTRKADSLSSHGIEPAHQKHWDWKAAGNFLCGGAGASLFVFALLGGLMGAPIAMLGALALGMIAVGLLGLMFKIGRPTRFIYVLRQPQRSWMSREAWIIGFLFPVGGLTLWLASTALGILAAVLGLLFLFSQGMILKEAKGIPAWRSARIVPLIVTTGLCEGAGLFAFVVAAFPAFRAMTTIAMMLLATLTIIRVIAWESYRVGLNVVGVPARTIGVLGHFQPWFYVIGAVVPLGLIGTAFAVPLLTQATLAVAGLSAFVAGWAMKFILITRAGYNQGFAIKHLVDRRSAVPERTSKPGWA